MNDKRDFAKIPLTDAGLLGTIYDHCLDPNCSQPWHTWHYYRVPDGRLIEKHWTGEIKEIDADDLPSPEAFESSRRRYEQRSKASPCTSLCPSLWICLPKTAARGASGHPGDRQPEERQHDRPRARALLGTAHGVISMYLLTKISNDHEEFLAIVPLDVHSVNGLITRLQTAANLADTCGRSLPGVECVILSIEVMLYSRDFSTCYDDLQQLLGANAGADTYVILSSDPAPEGDAITTGGDCLRVYPDGSVELATRPGDDMTWADSCRLPLLSILMARMS